MYNKKKGLLYIVIALILLIITMLGSMAIGPGLDIRNLPYILRLIFLGGDGEGVGFAILTYRMVRVLLAVITGFVLSYSGATLQITLNNPLADPYLLGLSAGAGFGAGLSGVLSFNVGIAGITTRTIFAFMFGLLAVYTVYRLSRREELKPTRTIIIIGIIMSSFLSSAIIFLLIIAPFRDQHQLLLWLLGDLSSPQVSIYHITVIGLLALTSFLSLIFRHKELDIISGGEEQAIYLGVDVERQRRMVFLFVSLATGAVVSITGLIGFIGIVVPHGTRAIVGPRSVWLLPISAIIGGITLLIADTISRVLITYFPIPTIPVGAITAFFGAPYFLYIYMRKQR
ncbi:MAG: FecCD family ABC transporter permease [bacterium]